MKRILALRIFPRRTSSATPPGSRSTPTDGKCDWVRSALDIATRMAVADDLAQIPSVKGIAGIFTQMLERLQVSFTVLR